MKTDLESTRATALAQLNQFLALSGVEPPADFSLGRPNQSQDCPEFHLIELVESRAQVLGPGILVPRRSADQLATALGTRCRYRLVDFCNWLLVLVGLRCYQPLMVFVCHSPATKQFVIDFDAMKHPDLIRSAAGESTATTSEPIEAILVTTTEPEPVSV